MNLTSLSDPQPGLSLRSEQDWGRDYKESLYCARSKGEEHTRGLTSISMFWVLLLPDLRRWFPRHTDVEIWEVLEEGGGRTRLCR